MLAMPQQARAWEKISENALYQQDRMRVAQKSLSRLANIENKLLELVGI